MTKCVAPRTRQHWADYLADKDEEGLRSCLRSADDGLLRHKGKSTHHHHDWTIFRNCCLHELRRRGMRIYS